MGTSKKVEPYGGDYCPALTRETSETPVYGTPDPVAVEQTKCSRGRLGELDRRSVPRPGDYLDRCCGRTPDDCWVAGYINEQTKHQP
jgi:hypothetical protein